MMSNQLNLVEAPEFSALFPTTLPVGLESLNGKRIFFHSDSQREMIPLQNLNDLPRSIPFQVMNFARQARERTVIGVDSSCVLIGETEDGAIYAAKASTVRAVGGKISRYLRAGPYLIYINPETSRDALGQVSSKIKDTILDDHQLAERFIRIRLERGVQIEAARNFSDSIIMLDGAIRSSVFETKEISLRKLEELSEDNFNQLVAISKSTGIRLVSVAASMLQSLSREKVYFDISDSLRAPLSRCGDRTLVVTFSKNMPSFRVDTSHSNAEDDGQVLSDIRSNDVFHRGYPECLRLAHHLSVFDSATIASIRSYLSRKYRVVNIPSDDLRATILGKLV